MKLVNESLYENFSADYIKSNMEKIGGGTEGDIYSDGKFAYKIVPFDLVPSPKNIIKRYVGKNFKNVVNIYDAWSDPEDDYYTIIKMEELEELPLNKVDEDEYEAIRDVLWSEIFDETTYLPYIIEDIKDPEIKKMVQSIYNASKELNTTHLDLGFHNLMYDPKTNEYKQIDIF